MTTNEDRQPVQASAPARLASLADEPAARQRAADESQAPLVAGEVVAERFVVGALAGRGGMGAVYRARDLELGRPVAIKVITRRRERADDRFALESLALAELSHPRIVRYVAHGVTTSGAPFLAMEWLDGEDLATRLSRGGLDVQETFAVVRGLCEGLTAAHRRGIIHRDIKPSNIFLVASDAANVKLLDFGVARRLVAPQLFTRAGALLGTVGYMAPEQAMGRLDVDARADVFAVGCVLFECLTGKPAFAANDEVAVLAKVLCGDQQPVSALRPELGADIDALLSQLLAKEPSARPQDAAAVLRLLAPLGALVGGPPKPSFDQGSEHFISGEQRMLSVILGRSRALQPHAASRTCVPHELSLLARSYGAELTSLQGGALLLLMGNMRAATAADQAVQAARCALALGKVLPEFALGVATGAVNTSSKVPVGDAIDRAATLLASAETAGVITLDALTAGLLGRRFAVEDASHGLCLMGELEEGEALGVLMGKITPFVGRAKELGLLEATLRECIDDQVARAVLVTAPSGAGKSRLGREFAERARKGGARLLAARADPTSAGSSLNLVKRLVRAASGMRQGVSHVSERACLESYLQPLVEPAQRATLVDFLAELVGVSVEEPPPSELLRAARNDPEVMREQKRRAFEAWIGAECARQPLVLLIEDLHWGDLPSICYLQDALRVFARRPLFLLALARPEVHEHFPMLRDASALDEVRLKALTSRASEQLVRASLPESVDDAIVERIVRLAEGNAFYLEELVRRVAQGGTDLPDTVLAMAQSRLEQLPAEARRALLAASIFGETAWTGGISMLVGEPDSLLLCENLAEQEILIRRTDTRFPNEREFCFRHAFLREAAYALLSESDKVNGHRMVAEWLEARGERDARVLADHFQRGGAAERAIYWLVFAAIAALGGGDIKGALSLTQRGVQLQATGPDRGMLLLFGAYASAWSVMHSDPQHLSEALELLPRASAPWWLAVSLQVYNASMIGRPALAEPYLALALETSPGLELTGVYGHALQTLAAGAALMGRAEVGWRLVQQFEQFMASKDEPKRDQVFLAWFNLTRCVLACNSKRLGRWRLGDALSWGRESVQGMQDAGSAAGETIALFYLGRVYSLLGCYEEAEAAQQRSLMLAEKMGNQLVCQHAALMLSVFSLRSGALGAAQRSLAGLEHSANVNIAHGAGCVLAESEVRDGKLEAALARTAVLASGPCLMYRRMATCTRARALLALERPEEALAALDGAERDGSAFPQFDLDLLCSRAQASFALGKLDSAREALARAVQLRKEVAATIDDVALRDAFLARGQSHGRLDRLVRMASRVRMGGDSQTL